jgi:hypothetical protein
MAPVRAGVGPYSLYCSVEDSMVIFKRDLNLRVLQAGTDRD